MKKFINNHFRLPNDQRGAVLIIFALLLTVLIGLTALGVEAGRWYATRAELSKAVDAAALAGAKNISNPNVDLATLVDEVGRENFSPGYLASAAESLQFTMTRPDNKKVKITGRVDSPAMLARVIGIDLVAASSSGVGEKNKVEIMLVLDRSGSMSGTPINDLKTAAKKFVEFFEETEGEDKMGLVTFATGVTLSPALNTTFVNAITAKINAMAATGATNAEDAIKQGGDEGAGGLTDQTGLSGDLRVQQYLIFFTDGMPTAFRNTFKRNGADYDAVVCGTGNYCGTVYGYMGHTDSEIWYPQSTLTPIPTGDGKPTATTKCKNCPTCPPYLNTKWYVFGAYPVSGYGAEDCKIPNSKLAPYICSTARQMARDHANELKDPDTRNIKIYIIGLGSVDKAFLGQIASGPDYEFYTPSSSELEAIFQKIAKEIKLRLVQQ